MQVNAAWKPLDWLELKDGLLLVDSAQNGLTGVIHGTLFRDLDVQVSVKTGACYAQRSSLLQCGLPSTAAHWQGGTILQDQTEGLQCL